MWAHVLSGYHYVTSSWDDINLSFSRSHYSLLLSLPHLPSHPKEHYAPRTSLDGT